MEKYIKQDIMKTIFQLCDNVYSNIANILKGPMHCNGALIFSMIPLPVNEKEQQALFKININSFK